MTNIEKLETKGICKVKGLSTEQVDDISRSLRECHMYEGHVAQNKLPIGYKMGPDAYHGYSVTCWHMHDVVTAPHLLELGLSHIALAAEFLEQRPIIYSMNAFTTYPTNDKGIWYLQDYHQDHDDTKFLALFIYLTDVLSASDGVHQLVSRNGEVNTTIGERGTAFIADTSLMHRGTKPQIKPRSIAWIRYGVTHPNAAYQQDKTQPIDRSLLGNRYPIDTRLQEIISPIVR